METKTHNKLLCSKCLTGNQTPIGLDDSTSSLFHEKLEHIRELGSQGTAHLAKLREEEESFSSRLKGLEESRAHWLSEIRRVFLSLHEALQTLSSSSTSSPSLPQSLKEEDKLVSFLHHISSMFSMTSTSSFSPPVQSDWSKNKVQSEMTFSSQGNGNNQLRHPCGMTYSPDSKLFYICDSSNHRIQVFRNHPQAELEGRVEIEFLPPLKSVCSTSSLSSGRALNPPYIEPSPLSYPSDICYHDGQLFIVDSLNHRVQVWRAEDGSFLRMIGTGSAGNALGQFNGPWGCTVYQNHLFVSESGNHRIQKFSLSDFSVVKVIGSKGTELGQLKNPRELSVFNDKLYVAERNNNRISVFDPESGAALSVIGPSLLNDGNLSHPRGILFSHNLLFVSSINRISIFDSDHNYLYSFGSYGSGKGRFSDPIAMVMVNAKLFVCEFGSHRVQVFQQTFD